MKEFNFFNNFSAKSTKTVRFPTKSHARHVTYAAQVKTFGARVFHCQAVHKAFAPTFHAPCVSDVLFSRYETR